MRCTLYRLGAGRGEAALKADLPTAGAWVAAPEAWSVRAGLRNAILTTASIAWAAPWAVPARTRLERPAYLVRLDLAATPALATRIARKKHDRCGDPALPCEVVVDRALTL